jgi:ABC-type siderophore export system fused ATPase/permease subunit
MNWIIIPVLIIYLLVVMAIKKRFKTYLLQEIVRIRVLKNQEYFPDLTIQIFNGVLSFVLLPIFMIGLALMIGDIPYNYDWTLSIVAYFVTLLAM